MSDARGFDPNIWHKPDFIKSLAEQLAERPVNREAVDQAKAEMLREVEHARKTP